MRLAVLTALLFCQTAWAQPPQIADGPFKGNEESLEQYRCPDWFRDAKFGIWSHWGPQAVPMQGDWYAKHMYVQGHRQYEHHLKTYGHPSEHGYKEIIDLWKAEKWDPDQLMDLYKKAGARYFVSMGSHHDNFFLWNSKIHRWNSVKMGPKRDVVGDWQKSAKKHGLRFGVSEHLVASFTWFQPSHGSDKKGPKTGIPYDGADPKLQDLYHFPAKPGDTGWNSNDPRYHKIWFNEIKELVDNYQPDLLYSDSHMPFGNEVGASLIAHLYNTNEARHAGKLEAVYTCKQKSEGRWVEDLERGVMPKINPHPWQTDTSIGDWYYNEHWKPRPVSWTIHMLVDIVSKNGNLLLNVVQRPDGSIDDDVRQSLEQLADWIAIHGEAIYETRPWLVYGEGGVRYRGGSFKEDFNYSARDIRFTTKGPSLYAVALGWPDDGKLLVRSLASVAGKINTVSLLGYDGNVDWQQTDEGLVVTVPTKAVSEYTCALKITGEDLKPAPIPKIIITVSPDKAGNYVLKPDDAELNGDQIKIENKGGQPNVGYWDRADESVAWTLSVDKPGKFNVSALIATAHADGEFVVDAAGQRLVGKPAKTSGWEHFQETQLGSIRIDKPGKHVLTMQARDAKTWKPINVRQLKLVRDK
ncbi:Alpha-L-fucosidase [Planctomycetes bacterium CA13]|uniref:alpha-L-fucosidase n=1 Tax=Novipirellula herctigrandis TaxID=2527986 RepID=A0A5C5Z2H0_9BACT|nr:Alpha-L-fucosidase [Planctomycetes bacterium CA13]